MSEQGLSDHLVLLSVQQTCKYRGVGFLKFLLSGQNDVATYRERKRERKPQPVVEVYPDGFSGTHRKCENDHRSEGEAP